MLDNNFTIRAITPANFPQSIGMCEKTGKAITGLEHLKQSLKNIILTDKFQRVMRRDYGSDFFEQIDSKATENNVLHSYAELAEIIARWEPRFDLKRIVLSAGEQLGQFIYGLSGDFLGSRVEMEFSA